MDTIILLHGHSTVVLLDINFLNKPLTIVTQPVSGHDFYVLINTLIGTGSKIYITRLLSKSIKDYLIKYTMLVNPLT